MNYSEKKALFSFLGIYIGSAVAIIGAMLYYYYINEKKALEDHCSMEMSNSAYEIKENILNSYMNNEEFVPKPLNVVGLQYALYDKNKKEIYSTLEEKISDFTQKEFDTKRYTYHVAEIKDEQVPIQYIVIETCQGIDGKESLKWFIVLVLILSAIFTSFVAYLLAKLLLKPVREKIEHMDQFIKDSAHELNTPVSVLLTSVSTLKQGRNPEKMMKYILSSSKQISQVYNDIHYSAFLNSEETLEEEFDVSELIQESVDFYFDICNAKDIKISTSLETTEILMDKTKTQKIINNLLSNAVKYSNRRSVVNVTLKEGLFSVEDFGIGISEDEQKNIFKRYKRGKDNNEGGFGIGLDIVSKITYEYGLNLTLKSKVREGSTFTVDFKSIKI